MTNLEKLIEVKKYLQQSLDFDELTDNLKKLLRNAINESERNSLRERANAIDLFGSCHMPEKGHPLDTLMRDTYNRRSLIIDMFTKADNAIDIISDYITKEENKSS